MAILPAISFSALSAVSAPVLVVFAQDDLAFSESALAALGEGAENLKKAAEVAAFKGKKSSMLDLLVPAGVNAGRVLVVGLGKADELSAQDWTLIGGEVYGKLKALKVAAAEVCFDGSVEAAGAFAEGALLRGYEFDDYKTKKKDDDGEGDYSLMLEIKAADVAAASASWAEREAVARGALLARQLVNTPPNDLGPIEFAAKAVELESLGIETEVLDVEQMEKLGMGALLGVARGSRRPARIAIMKWNGGKDGDAPIAFVGKGVVFDSGGISLKPGAGMDEMKGDMGGAGAVTGLMYALAARKAKANVIGVIGLVENMPDGDAQRPGDIVTTMSGQTIEILNTDAEGRLVLADALWYTNDRFKPSMIVDLATLTGACMVALGIHRAGLFSNDDELAGRIFDAGEATEEKYWRLPLGKEYDKQIDTPNADMKNTGGNRWGGASTAAVMLQRFIGETPWAHLDIAGTAMGSPKSAISQGWASGFGVRSLNKLVKDHYEA
ncbi:leucyl aminopeptidase [Rhodobacteraceae bacterium RKSG542]|uniref:leucyl aminopeptidase n=1 Tax=Pseudovibrio flavus TaxID=2529854 RepID=UPI0012BBB4A1|nr:leucyl aminopeptidase [Pseudovibrio flavus]MTI17604.1 leucyl aminopeptidase [Pseudovibrio flavus]